MLRLNSKSIGYSFKFPAQRVLQIIKKSEPHNRFFAFPLFGNFFLINAFYVIFHYACMHIQDFFLVLKMTLLYVIYHSKIFD